MIRARAEAGFVYLPTEIHSSSVINNLTRCNCFIDLKAGIKVEPGDKVGIRYIKGLKSMKISVGILAGGRAQALAAPRSRPATE
ncbi:MAG: hypothetical protein ACLTK0_09795 [Anaerovoracaceae bacterium]